MQKLRLLGPSVPEGMFVNFDAAEADLAGQKFGKKVFANIVCPHFYPPLMERCDAFPQRPALRIVELYHRMEIGDLDSKSLRAGCFFFEPVEEVRVQQ